MDFTEEDLKLTKRLAYIASSTIQARDTNCDFVWCQGIPKHKAIKIKGI